MEGDTLPGSDAALYCLRPVENKVPMPTLRAEALNLPLSRPFTISRGSKSVAENVLVEIEHEGIVGLGEAAPNARYGQTQQSVLSALRRFDAPRDAWEQMDVLALVAAFAEQHPGERAAQAALEMALWDWAGKKLDRPLHRLLAIDPEIRARSSWSISIDEPEQTAERVAECEGWPILKLKLGGGDHDLRAVEALRAATDRPFRVDANEAWSLEEAREKLPWLEAQGCELVEQPLPAGRLELTRQLYDESPLPLVADEDAPDLMALDALVGAYDGINVKLMKCGGIRDAVQMIHAATARGFSIMLGCMIESSVGIAAAAQLAPLAHWLDLDGAALLAQDPFEGLSVRAGVVTMPEGPGLGVRRRA